MLNKATLLGHVGKDPEIRALSNGDKVASFSLATSERWKNKDGERQERTEWHRIVVYAPGLVAAIESYVAKGSRLYVEGQIQQRSYEKDGETRHVSEIVLTRFAGRMVMLSGKQDEDDPTAPGRFLIKNAEKGAEAGRPTNELEEDLAF